MTGSQVPVLEGRELELAFGHVQALRGASLEVFPGEIVALVGDNGAGKSTLVKSLVGVQQADRGEIRIDGKPVVFHDPSAAREAGIETVYQDLALAPDLDAASNIFLGRELRRFRVLHDQREMRARTAEAFRELGVGVQDVSIPVSSYSGGQQQSVAVARAAMWATKVIFLDEPTAALGVLQTARVLDLVKRISERGIGVVLISHNMPQVLEVADRMVVLRLGEVVAKFRREEATVEKLVAAITGGLRTEGASS